MKQSLFTLEHTRQLTDDTYELVLSGDTSAITVPGQFVNIALPGKFLRRPISICTWNREALILLVKVVGAGSHDLVRCVPGTELVKALSQGELPLEEAVEQYKLGLDMASQCQKMLRDAEGEIRILQDGVEKAFQMEE